jgi:hypothetical protein
MGQKLKPPAKTPEARENQCINMAMNLAAERLAEGTASSQIICHFLKAGALKTQYELEKIRSETELQRAKIEAIKQAERLEEVYVDAIEAMKNYQGGNFNPDD